MKNIMEELGKSIIEVSLDVAILYGLVMGCQYIDSKIKPFQPMINRDMIIIHEEYPSEYPSTFTDILRYEFSQMDKNKPKQ